MFTITTTVRGPDDTTILECQQQEQQQKTQHHHHHQQQQQLLRDKILQLLTFAATTATNGGGTPTGPFFKERLWTAVVLWVFSTTSITPQEATTTATATTVNFADLTKSLVLLEQQQQQQECSTADIATTMTTTSNSTTKSALKPPPLREKYSRVLAFRLVTWACQDLLLQLQETLQSNDKNNNIHNKHEHDQCKSHHPGDNGKNWLWQWTLCRARILARLGIRLCTETNLASRNSSSGDNSDNDSTATEVAVSELCLETLFQTLVMEFWLRIPTTTITTTPFILQKPTTTMVQLQSELQAGVYILEFVRHYYAYSSSANNYMSWPNTQQQKDDDDYDNAKKQRFDTTATIATSSTNTNSQMMTRSTDWIIRLWQHHVQMFLQDSVGLEPTAAAAAAAVNWKQDKESTTKEEAATPKVAFVAPPAPSSHPGNETEDFAHIMLETLSVLLERGKGNSPLPMTPSRSDELQQQQQQQKTSKVSSDDCSSWLSSYLWLEWNDQLTALLLVLLDVVSRNGNLHQQQQQQELILHEFWIPLLARWTATTSTKSAATSATTNGWYNKMRLRHEWAMVLLAYARELALLSSSSQPQRLQQPTQSDFGKLLLGSNHESSGKSATTTSTATVRQGLIQLLLASVISPSTAKADESSLGGRNDDLRALAWSTVSVLISTFGWEWLLVTASSSNTNTTSKGRLGSATTACTIIRLAVGEWKIQLSRMLEESSSSQSPSTAESNANSSATRSMTIKACSVTIQQALKLVIQLAAHLDDDDDDHNDNSSLPPFSSDAILHLRRSLQDALSTAVEWFGERSRNQAMEQLLGKPNDDCARSILDLDISAAQVFGTLLTEFDAFDNSALVNLSRTAEYKSRQDRNQDAKDDNDSENSHAMLAALRVALQVDAVETRRNLVPAVTTALASAEGDAHKVQVLIDYDILSNDTLTRFWLAYWKDQLVSDDNDTTQSTQRATSASTVDYDSIPWACQGMELWFTMDVPLRVVKDLTEQQQQQGPLMSLMIEWLRQEIVRSNAGHCPPVAREAMQAIVSCFVTCHGEEGELPPPGVTDEQASILQRAMEMLSSNSPE